jgi:DNA replication and repair protein RecF
MQQPLCIQKIFIKNFRNFKEDTVTFGAGLNLVEGDNGQGKTNLLEAICFLGIGRSFRTSHLCDLLQWNTNYFLLEAQFLKEGLSQTLKIFYSSEKKSIQYNDTRLPSFSHLLGLIPLVIYSPEDLSLIDGPPGERRRFLDLFLSQKEMLYAHHLRRYSKALLQRNELLKRQQLSGIEPWEEILAQSGSILMSHRSKAIEELNARANPLFSRLTESSYALKMVYRQCIEDGKDLSSQLLSRYRQEREKEFHSGTTQTGPHREDVKFCLNEQEVKNFASMGQKRSVLAALRSAEWELLKESLQVLPLFAIDDFTAHLDEKRQQLWTQLLQTGGQSFLTSPAFSTSSPSSLRVEAGQLIQKCFT